MEHSSHSFLQQVWTNHLYKSDLSHAKEEYVKYLWGYLYSYFN